ncbi:MAG: DUF4202 domain-containing protein [Tepidisphaeraceae bacterium]
MGFTSPKLDIALAAFDDANAVDPRTTFVDGQAVPDELLYARRMTDRLMRFAPDASEPLQLAARCQHLCRWMIPRETYPMDRRGYHQWRTILANFHADKAGEILRRVGYDEETIARVQSLVRKERFKTDPDAQTLEDVICLVFLEYQFAEFASEHDEEKVIGILRKTWSKMSDRGRAEAMRLVLTTDAGALVRKAIEREGTI